MRLKPLPKHVSPEVFAKDSPMLAELHRRYTSGSKLSMSATFDSNDAFSLSKKLLKYSMLGLVTALSTAAVAYYTLTYRPNFDPQAVKTEQQALLKAEGKSLA